MPLPIKWIHKNETGLTLIEVLASLVLLSLMTVSIMSAFTPAASWINKARRETTASNYAAAILEDLRSDRNKINNSNAGKSARDLFPAYGYPWAGMTDEITRLERQNPPYSNLYDVTVTVSWSEGTKTRSLQISTMIKKD
ncbi:MAG: prepilin-type N-terminal cleavage/methylation domain-containing protein [Syntrophomonas sp.]|nr:prepilin-type N-terminal cleavage/methylation domain-containing protein [Syntrophomonas sp.]